MTSSTPTPAPAPPPGLADRVVPEAAIFVTDECYCRPWREADAGASAELCNDPGIARWMRDAFPHPYTLEDARRWIATARSSGDGTAPYHLAIVAGGGDRGAGDGDGDGDGAVLVGGIGLTPGVDVGARAWEVGYWVGRRHWGRGIATAALAAFARWAFAAFPRLLRLEARVFAGNAASEAVLRRAGFRREGLLRRAVFKDGRALDLLVYGLLREDVGGEAGREDGTERGGDRTGAGRGVA